jgi:hypothetical protein
MNKDKIVKHKGEFYIWIKISGIHEFVIASGAIEIHTFQNEDYNFVKLDDAIEWHKSNTSESSDISARFLQKLTEMKNIITNVNEEL